MWSATIDIPRLGEHIRRRRAERTLREVAEEIQVNMNTISRLERGVTKPDLDSYARICAWLGVPMDTFRLPLFDEAEIEAQAA